MEVAMRRPQHNHSSQFKVLIVHPNFGSLGGIQTYFLKLSPYLRVPHVFFAIAQRPGEAGLFGRVGRIINDYRRYWSLLSDPVIDIVHLNPSLEPKSFYREAIFFLMAKVRRKKTLVFFHGWRVSFQQRIDKHNGWIVRLLFGKADAFVVLAATFAEKLRCWGLTQPIHSEVTIISDDVVAGFDLESTIDARLATERWRLLFVSRLMRSKGILIAIEAQKILQQTHPQFDLFVAGDGECAQEAKELARKLKANVFFQGIVTGDELYGLLRSAHIMCFPTMHDEGFPNTIVEAMAFGLPVVTRAVGGVSDFFESAVHGYITTGTSPAEFAEMIIRMAEDREHYRRMARANYQYAQTHFLASRAASRIEEIYESIRRQVPLEDGVARVPLENAASAAVNIDRPNRHD
jgi:glycosyltransferase involved in cell wall biosynthesis